MWSNLSGVDADSGSCPRRLLDHVGEDVMAEYGGIFAYHESAVFFEYLNFAFMSVYGLAVVCIVALSNPGKSSPFPPSLANPD
jgi:hypothetical protein